MNELTPVVGRAAACRALGANRASVYRRLTARPPRPARPRPTPPRALSIPEREAVLTELNSERFCDLAPNQVYAILLDEGRYLWDDTRIEHGRGVSRRPSW